jgi:cytochrome b6-f complex iron-sulfur subunit
MATKQVVTKVWIEEGCIVCDACETTAPDVFDVTDDSCLIRPDAMNAAFTKVRTDSIVDAAEECPVDVIKFDTVTEEVADDQPATAPSAPSSAPAAAPAPSAADESKPAAPAKSPAPAAVAHAPASLAGAPDPSIAALLRAATTRGGSAGIERRGDDLVSAVDGDVKKLPPEARQERVLDAARKAKKDAEMSRRGFSGGLALATGWTAFGLGTAVSAGPAFVRFLMPNVLEEPDPRVRVGKLQKYLEMNAGDVNEDYKPQGIWMIREEERVAALNIICTHLGCIPNWLPNDRKFKCPCHGSGYRPDGVNFEGPTPRPLERFRVMVVDGLVVVDKSKKFQAELGQWDMPGSFLAV